MKQGIHTVRNGIIVNNIKLAQSFITIGFYHQIFVLGYIFYKNQSK